MKKSALLISSIFIFVLSTGCSSNQGDSNVTESTNNIKDEQTTSQSEESSTNEEMKKEEVYFKNNEAKLKDLKIVITETKVILPGETGNEYSDKPVFAIWYDTKNITGKEIDPMTAWIVVFEAVQDNNPNAINTLQIGMLPDNQFLDSQLETIKQNGTVSNAVAYELDDLETPVTLIATQGISGDKLGEQTFEIK